MSVGEPPRTVQQRVLQTLRTQILNGELTAGTRLIQNDIAATMMVSTTPIREALRQLQAEGLVHIDEHRGGVVRALDVDELEDLLRWRRYMEPEAIRQAIPLSEDARSRALELHELMADPATSEAEFALLNREFHLTIYGSGRSRALTAIMKIVMDPVVAYVNASLEGSPSLRVRSVSEHQRLIEALEREDVEEAIRLQLAHIERPRSEWAATTSTSNRPESPDSGSSDV